MKPDYLFLDTILYADLRKSIGVVPSTFTNICRKARVDVGAYDLRRGAARKLSSQQARAILEYRGLSYPSSAKTLSFMMCKGGVGKTTSSYFLSRRLAEYGARILIIDADPQGNLTSSFNLEEYGCLIDEETPVLNDVVDQKIGLSNAIMTLSPNIHLLPSTPLNSMLENTLRKYSSDFIEVALDIISDVKDQYDYIVFDTAPALNLTNAMIVRASDQIVLPVCLDKFSQIGLTQTLSEIEGMEKDFGFTVERKVLLTKFDIKEDITLKYLGEIALSNRELLFDTIIRNSSELQQVISRNQNLFSHKKSLGKEDYDDLAKEVLYFKEQQVSQSMSRELSL